MRTYQGSCHCGAVRFAAAIDLANGTVRCNCSICAKLRFWPAIIDPASFQLLTGSDVLGDYQFHPGRDHHYFCKHCGVHAFGTGESPRWGKFYAVHLPCLDDATPEELAAAPVTWVDGRNGNWEKAPTLIAHL